MIEESPIVKDTRRVRQSISEKFDNDSDKYIDYLMTQETGSERETADCDPESIPKEHETPCARSSEV